MDASTSRLPRALRPTFLRRPWFSLGLLLALLVACLALFAPLVSRQDPLKQSSTAVPVPPSAGHPLGQDSYGRDVLSRLVYGARLSLAIGLGAVVVAVGLGVAVGVSAGYFGGWIEAALMRLTDVVLAFPAVLLALALTAVLPQRNVATLVLVIGFLNWAAAARVFRSETLSLRERQYVEAARVQGASHPRILFRHVLPHLGPTVGVLASLGAASTILLDTGLAFLGRGIPPPAPTWGSMLQEAQQWYTVAPWLAVWPGLAVLATVAAFNLIAFDLRSRSRSQP